MCFQLLPQKILWDIEFTDEQRERILNATFEIAELMDELDGYRSILDIDGYPKEHKRADDLIDGIQFILSDFEDNEQQEIIRLVNFQRGET